MNKRLTIYLDPESQELINKTARDLKISKSALIRICINKSLRKNTFVV